MSIGIDRIDQEPMKTTVSTSTVTARQLPREKRIRPFMRNEPRGTRGREHYREEERQGAGEGCRSVLLKVLPCVPRVPVVRSSFQCCAGVFVGEVTVTSSPS